MTTLPSESYWAYRTQRESHWDRLALSTTHEGLNSGYHQRLTELYRNIIPAGQSILEIGCGKGALLAALEPSRGVGIDFSREMLRHGAELHPNLEFIHGDAHELGALDGAFDAIIFSDLLNDLWDVQCFLEQV
jgi:ubiquinone/menaquinone biosynthesis C-methylase UbiE